ncbi:plasmid mobilization relaxosome protein MobC [uncultured Odoribacter sp.]|uniref:plasmid mobilization protein n=1 Tax=uncultured Odoribacter sp. TaxID=876416 RepID=UPI00260AF766|nr:plasmid mobilization relaxosome protein MobC [uncultured Odoribacter sp.]
MTNKLSQTEALHKNRNINGRPRLSATEKKGDKVTVKFATAEYYFLKSIVKKAGRTISLFVRKAIRQCEVKQCLNSIHLSYVSQLTGMANNLNQIAHKANVGGYATDQTEYLTLASRIDNLINSIMHNS